LLCDGVGSVAQALCWAIHPLSIQISGKLHRPFRLELSVYGKIDRSSNRERSGTACSEEDEMNDLSATFSNNPATAILCFSSTVFLLIYLTGFILLQRWSRLSGPTTPVIHRHIISGLGAALAAMGFGFWLYAAHVATASAEGQTGATTSMSAQELHQSVKIKSLPVQRFEDQTMVFPNRD
jgi:hypothetical protein